ncbi:NAD(P)-dependent dehydrogenase, short-chain alcohol dehydrogenase family [Lutibacter agarilyticus]|uniref:NAD(P)-dependent dehydrogenase, short-chain alcohol dehydrogenase family n=1 Tax=Lutibacter agarilyticus TaxID=1109740 RepID=A0A238Z5M5_9FLAO|nr:SDR family oxidoreductase [Lutibacter agarilyticus]SNR78133.1 NAD(P)-dependent dehydrogenase, short-chain alcohol dehydrogenase family [Lutibacter agarilyticus]
MNFNRFKNKVAIVTGGSSGLGYSIVEEFCKEGGKVLFTGISDRGIEVEHNFKKEGYNVTFLHGDMGLEEFCKETILKTIEIYGKIDCLVNNAFSFTAKGVNATKEDWLCSLNTGPVAFARMVQFAVPYMKENGGGAVVNISSISAYIAQIDRWTYNASKGAVHQLTKCQALDLAKFNIRVNEVAPGWTWSNETDKAADLDGGGREKWGPIWGKFQILNRMAQPIEIARPTLFMLSDDASFITGTTLDVDGGYLALGPEGLGESTVNAGSK